MGGASKTPKMGSLVLTTTATGFLCNADGTMAPTVGRHSEARMEALSSACQALKESLALRRFLRTAPRCLRWFGWTVPTCNPSKISHLGLGQNKTTRNWTGGFSPCFYLPKFHFGYLFFDPQCPTPVSGGRRCSRLMLGVLLAWVEESRIVAAFSDTLFQGDSPSNNFAAMAYNCLHWHCCNSCFERTDASLPHGSMLGQVKRVNILLIVSPPMDVQFDMWRA